MRFLFLMCEKGRNRRSFSPQCDDPFQICNEYRRRALQLHANEARGRRDVVPVPVLELAVFRFDLVSCPRKFFEGFCRLRVSPPSPASTASSTCSAPASTSQATPPSLASSTRRRRNIRGKPQRTARRKQGCHTIERVAYLFFYSVNCTYGPQCAISKSQLSRLQATSRRMIRVGLPAARQLFGTRLLTRLCAPMMLPSPMKLP